MRKATQLTALLVASMLSGIAAAADARWRLDLAGGALAVPSSVRPGLGKGFGFSCCEAEASRSHFESGGSYAVGVGYALTERLARLELRAPLCGGPESSCTNGDGDEVDDGFGINVGGGVDLAVTRWLSLGLDLRYHNALTVLGGFDFVTTLFDVSFRF